MKRRSWTDEQLIVAVKNSISVRATLICLGLNSTGGNYKSIQNHINRLNLNTDHFLGQGYTKGKGNVWFPTKSLDEILTINSTYQSYKLNRRLIKEGLLKDQCYSCGINTWKDKKLSLHLDHINGVNNDNRIENLRLLCPNCHSLTETYSGKNIGKH